MKKNITGPLYRIQIRMPSPAILNMIIMRNFSFFSPFFKYQITDRMKKRSETQTLPLAVVRRAKNFRPAADLLPRARDGQNLISWRWSLPSPTDPVSWRSMHAISSYRGNRPTNKQTHTHKQTDRGVYNTLRHSLASNVISHPTAIDSAGRFSPLQCCHLAYENKIETDYHNISKYYRRFSRYIFCLFYIYVHQNRVQALFIC